MARAFPEDTFPEQAPSFEFVCATTDPHEGALVMRSRVVWARRGEKVTPAMREWSRLGWYAMAAFALIQTRCCPSPAPLRAPLSIGACKLDEALGAWTAAVKAGRRPAIDAALARYTAAVDCAAHSGAGAYFGLDHPPSGQEPAVLERMVGRLTTPR